jgi:hypothetical protein
LDRNRRDLFYEGEKQVVTMGHHRVIGRNHNPNVHCGSDEMILQRDNIDLLRVGEENHGYFSPTFQVNHHYFLGDEAGGGQF